jgi:hypothetical protein
MALLLPEDYKKLAERGIAYDESEEQRFFIFTAFTLPDGLYTVDRCDVLVVIPPNYNQAGNDMLWTDPRLRRANGAGIPNANDPGQGDNRIWKGREFCRWSRHWQSGTNVWRPGRDDIISIYRRIDWALKHPDCQQ